MAGDAFFFCKQRLSNRNYWLFYQVATTIADVGFSLVRSSQREVFCPGGFGGVGGVGVEAGDYGV